MNFFLKVMSVAGLLWLCPGMLLAQNVQINETNFPDAKFRAWVLANVAGASDGVLTATEIAKVTTIKCSSQGIADLTGIEYFTAVTTLECYSNSLTSLDVSALTKMKVLRCYSNRLTSIQLPKTATLTNLRVDNNQLKSIDVTALTGLQHLYCYNNRLRSLDVTKNTSLQSLRCYNNLLKKIDVSQNPSLTGIYCFTNQLTALDVTNNTNLQVLSCYGNNISSIDLSKNTKLRSINCSQNPITQLDLSANSALTGLYCYSCSIESIDLTHNTALTQLLIHDNELETLDVSMLTGLTKFYCYQNKLTSIDVSTLTKLKNFECKSNRITALDLSNNPLLDTLNVANNRLKALDITHCPNITYMNMGVNQISSLDLSNNAKMKVLYIYTNNLKRVDLSTCPNLTYLNCVYNGLTTLDLSNQSLFDATDITSIIIGYPTTLSSGKQGIEVNDDFDLGKMSSLAVDGVATTATLTLEGGKTYLTFPAGSFEGKQEVTYNYATDYPGTLDAAKQMAVQFVFGDTDELATVAVNEVNFPDANFRKWIIDNIDGAEDLLLTSDEIKAVTGMYCSDQGIKDLKGFELFVNVGNLDVAGNEISSYDFLQCKRLMGLTIHSNLLAELDLSAKTNLTALSVYGNKLTSLKLPSSIASVLAYNNQLTALDLSACPNLTSVIQSVVTQRLIANTSVVGGKIAVPVSDEIKASNISELKVGGVETDFTVQTDGGRTFIVLNMDESEDVDGMTLTYKYNTDCPVDDERLTTMSVTIKLYQTGYVLKVSDAKMATLYLSYDAEVPYGVQPWYVKDVSQETAIMFAYPILSGIIPAYTPVFVTTDSAGDYVFNESYVAGTPVTDNILEGTLEDIDISDEEPCQYLTLSHGKTTGRLGFWYYTGSTLYAHRCFIPVSLMSTSSAALSQTGYALSLDGSTPTAIQTVDTSNLEPQTSTDIYTLDGRKVNGKSVNGQLPRGLYIINGRKVVVK